MGRKAGIWRRSSRPGWWATIDGRQVCFGNDRSAALRAFHAAKASPVVYSAAGRTLAEVIDRFLLDVRSNLAENTVKAYTRYLTRSANAAWEGGILGHLPTSELKPMHVSAVWNQFPKWSASTRRMVCVQITTALNWAVKQGLIPSNPLAGKIDVPAGRSRGRETVIGPDEFARLAEHASPRFREFLTACRLTGCRPGEVASVTAAQVDLVGRLWILAEHKTDADGMPRVVHLSEDAARLTAGLVARHPTGPLFRNERGRPWRGSTWARSMQKAREKAGLDRCIVYGLRHTFATELLTAGVPDAHVSALLGHRSTNMLHKHYNHLTGNAAALRKHLEVIKIST